MADETDDTHPEAPHPEQVATGFAGETTGAFLATYSATEETVLTPQPAREIIGDYEILGKLGQGGMGAVYRARQISLDRLVALKILPAALEADADFVARFQREARIAASLHHANLVKVYASGLADGCHFISMELIEGETLGQFIRRGPLPPPEALRICLDVARALQCGWDRAQLIHRDIKPGNIFLSDRGEVKVGDLGLAKSMAGDTTGLTNTGTAMGTPHYISPEQARGDRDLDFRADIYSLGCTLYQMLTGRTPYSGTDPMAVMSMHRDAPPPAILKVLPQCPIPLARLVGKMLKKVKRERPASYAELIAQIESTQKLFAPQESALESTLPLDPDTTLLETPGALPTPRSITPVTAPVVTAPLPAKSKTLLFAGVAGILLGAVALAAFLLRPKEEKLTKAELYAREREKDRQTGTAGTPPSAPADAAMNPVPATPWRDAMVESPLRGLLPNVEHTAQGWVLPPKMHWLFPAEGIQSGAIHFQAVWRAGLPPIPTIYYEDGSHVSAKIREGTCAMTYGKKPDQLETTLFAKNGPFAPTDDQIHDYLLLRAGGRLRAAFDGQWVMDIADPGSARGQLGIGLADASPAVVQKLAYLNLDGLSDAEGFKAIQSVFEAWQALHAPPKSTPDSAAIQPWPVGEPLQTQSGQARWEDSALRLEHGSIMYMQKYSSDAILRASIKLDAKAADQRLTLRIKSRYSLALRFDGVRQIMEVLREVGGSTRSIAGWPLPPIAPDQWSRVEIRAIGEQFTASLDGKVVGSVRTGEKTEPGGLAISSNGVTLFRDVEYVPLDGVTTAAEAEPWQDVLHDPSKLTLSPKVERIPEGLRFSSDGSARLTHAPLHDGAMRIRATSGGLHIDLLARDGNRTGVYQIHFTDTGSVLLDRRDNVTRQLAHLAKFNLPQPLNPEEDYTMELRFVGETLTVKVNEMTLGVVTDGTLSEGGMLIGCFDVGRGPTIVKSLELLNLDLPTAAKVSGK